MKALRSGVWLPGRTAPPRLHDLHSPMLPRPPWPRSFNSSSRSRRRDLSLGSAPRSCPPSLSPRTMPGTGRCMRPCSRCAPRPAPLQTLPCPRVLIDQVPDRDIGPAAIQRGLGALPKDARANFAALLAAVLCAAKAGPAPDDPQLAYDRFHDGVRIHTYVRAGLCASSARRRSTANRTLSLLPPPLPPLPPFSPVPCPSQGPLCASAHPQRAAQALLHTGWGGVRIPVSQYTRARRLPPPHGALRACRRALPAPHQAPTIRKAGQGRDAPGAGEDAAGIRGLARGGGAE